MNQRRRKKTLLVLDGPDGLVENTERMMKVSCAFYKKLFAKESKPNSSIGPKFWDDQDLL